ncbi:uncharacterized protein LOC117588039 isoform X1 [Drosophila guanche]|uniref:uncharacterized protein LOC117588039 isoform X1 n=1 Tax=Drosophila guanche TaxID=7266 RepID=UPI001471D659|nr:uncharacterized protein LOC117588039 isoform X1 [Drosophila guanche]
MESTQHGRSNMWRRRSFCKIKRCSIIFFSLLFIFIWVNHSNLEDDVATIPADHQNKNDGETTPRSERLYRLAQQQILKDREYYMLRKEREQTTTTETFEEYETTAMDIEFLANRKPKVTAQPAKRYFVYSQKCKMPYADPFSNEALAIYSPAKLRTCTNESDLITLSFDLKLQTYKMHVNTEVLVELDPNITGLACSYQEVRSGKGATRKFFSVLLPPVDMTENMALDRNISGIIAECRDEKNASRIVQRDAFPLVQVTPQTSRTESHPLPRQPSVIMLGLDTMSRMNFKRTMPKTAEYVQQLGWFEMEGYNKVADNTFPNLCTVLAGGKPVQLEKVCEEQGSCPWIWRDFKEAGYSTAYGEDIASDSVFSVSEPDFRYAPTDFYLRPLLSGLTESMHTFRRFGYNYCVGRRLAISYLYDFCMQFTQRLIEELDQPAFGFFWSCTFTHGYHYGASSLDGVFMDYLKILERHEIFEKAIVILFSDHGERFGDLAELPDGFLEERLPMLHIYLPPWFRKTYPSYAQSLYLNRNRLSSPYDLHNTLRHILQLNATKPEDLPPPANCPTSQSLFHPLPQERSCVDACIGDHWCTCNEFVAVKLNAQAYSLVKLTLFYINRWLVLKGHNKVCDRLLLADLDHAERKLLNEDNGEESMYGNIMIYRLRFHTNPPVGRFEATVRYHSKRQILVDFDIEDVSRLNRYHNDSLCIKDKIAKKFCFCNGIVDPKWINQ